MIDPINGKRFTPEGSPEGETNFKIGPSGAQYYFCFNLYFFKTKNHQ